jgi:hypothetical protein
MRGEQTPTVSGTATSALTNTRRPSANGRAFRNNRRTRHQPAVSGSKHNAAPDNQITSHQSTARVGGNASGTAGSASLTVTVSTAPTSATTATVSRAESHGNSTRHDVTVSAAPANTASKPSRHPKHRHAADFFRHITVSAQAPSKPADDNHHNCHNQMFIIFTD